MIDMIQNAKDLIVKGKQLEDPELIQMGMDLLEEYDDPAGVVQIDGDPVVPPPEPMDTIVDRYICSNCGCNIPVDRPGRKRCPDCKKHKLELIETVAEAMEEPITKPSYEELLEALENQQLQPKPRRDDIDQFNVQVRGNQNGSRLHYDDNGNPDGVIRRREEIDPSMITNIWDDNDEFQDIDKNDPINEKLKQITKVSIRTRKPAKLIEVKCENCNRIEKIHPIHSSGRGRHICTKCVGRRSQR